MNNHIFLLQYYPNKFIMETTANTYATKDYDEHDKEQEIDQTTKLEDSSNSLRKRLGMSSRGINSR